MKARRQVCRPSRKLLPGSERFELVVHMLRERLSPEQIAGKLRSMNMPNPAFCKVVVASAVFLSCYFHCRLLPLWVECDGADRLPISRCT